MRRLSIWTVALLSIFLAMCVIAAALELEQAIFGPNISLYGINSGFDLVQSLSLLPCPFAFLAWLYRVRSNADSFGSSGIPISPGWAVGYFFIPILFFFRPYQAVRDTWKASDPDSDFWEDAGAWSKVKSSLLVGWWWALWLISNTAGFVLTIFSYTSQGSRGSEAESFFADSLSAASCIAAILLVRFLSARQEEKYHRLTSSAGDR